MIHSKRENLAEFISQKAYERTEVPKKLLVDELIIDDPVP